MKVKQIKENSPLAPRNQFHDTTYYPDRHYYNHVEVQVQNHRMPYLNSIRRAVNCEISVRALKFNYEDLYTDDEFVLFDYIQRNISAIPIEQDEDRTFSIDKTADNEKITTVWSGDIRDSKGKPLSANSNIVVMRLNPRCTIRINNIRAEYGTGENDATHVLAFATASYDNILRFDTNGNTDVRTILKQAGNSIIARLQSLRTLLDRYEYEYGVYKLDVYNENSTLGNSFVRAAYDLYDKITATSMFNTEQRTLTLRLYTDEDYKKTMNNIIDHLIGVFNEFINSL